MKKNHLKLVGIMLIISLLIAGCGGAKPESAPAEEEAQAEVTDASVAEEASGENNAEADAAEQEKEAADATAETEADSAREPEIVEITADNWEQYFEIVPYHVADPKEPIEYMATDDYNGFELILKDEYTKNYVEKSGWSFNDKFMNMIEKNNGIIPYDDALLDSYKEDGSIVIPQAAEIKAKFLLRYDGEMLGADAAESDPGIRYPISLTADDGNPIEFEREAEINEKFTLSYLIANKLKDGKEVTSENNSPLFWTIREEFFTDHLGAHLVSVSVAPSSISGVDYEMDHTGEILDHFEITLEEISGTVAVW